MMEVSPENSGNNVSLEFFLKKNTNKEILSVINRLFDEKKIKILSLFLSHPQQQYTLSEIHQQTNVSMATIYRILKKFLALDLIFKEEIKQLKLYQLKKNEVTAFLQAFLGKEAPSPLELFVKKVKRLIGVDLVLHYGKEEPHKANILLIGPIGSDVDQAKQAESIARSIKLQYDFKVNHLSLTKEQYQQMTAMGLYQGRKKVLFKRE